MPIFETLSETFDSLRSSVCRLEIVDEHFVYVDAALRSTCSMIVWGPHAITIPAMHIVSMGKHCRYCQEEEVLSREVRDLYNAYLHKQLRPETALEITANFILDLINVFGERLDEATPLQDGWRQFAPFEFILYLNSLLARYKLSGDESTLEDDERILFHDSHILLAALLRSALTSHPDSFPDEDHYQIPDPVAQELIGLMGGW